MTRVAAIDCGTNSVRLLIADISADRLADVERRNEIVRLGQDVDRTGRLAPEALERTFTTMRGYANLIRKHVKPQEPTPGLLGMPVRVVATSATRDAENRTDFVSGVRDIFGVEPEVVSGAEEARLSFTGATRGLGATAAEGPYLVVDIGGGSTEFVVGAIERTGTAPATGTCAVAGAMSVDIGCVRLTERHLKPSGDPPSRDAVQAAIADIEAAMDRVEAAVPVRDARTLIGLAGSVTTVAGIALGLPAYDPGRIHHSHIPAERINEVTDRLLRMTHDERAALPVMHPGRVDVIGAGALILDRIVRRYGFRQIVVSEHDILDGIAWSLSSS